MPEDIVNIETAYQYGLSKEEFQEIKQILGRTPSSTEIYSFSLIWNDSTASIVNANKVNEITKKARRIIDESGINKQDAIDIGNDLACTLQIESSHLPAESYSESAYCTINLHRNILKKGAKPILGINSFHFGDLQYKNTKKSILEFINESSKYSNSFGAPLLSLQASFDECNNNKPMLNALLIGIKNKESLLSESAVKPGNKILIIAPESDLKINSPLFEKILSETIIDGLKSNLILKILGNSYSNFLNSFIQICEEIEHGIGIELDNIVDSPESKEINKLLISKTIASLILICKKENASSLIGNFNNSGISCFEIGEIINEEQLILSFRSKIVANLPFRTLKKKNSSSEDIYTEQTNIKEINEFDITQIPVQKNLREIAWTLIKHPNISSKRCLLEQYDSMVGISNMGTNFPSSASLVNLKESSSALAVSIESNSRYIKANPEIGIQIAICEAARKITCTGAKPTALTASLNFLNANHANTQNHFESVIKGMSKVCKKFKIPISGEKINVYYDGNKEYNSESDCFLPIISMIGILEDKNHHMTISFKNKGNIIFLIGQSKEDISSSEYLYSCHSIKKSPVPWFNLDMEYKVQATVHELIQKNYVCSVHTVSKGGMFISLVESGMRFGLGFDIITDTDIRTDAFLFGESQGRVIVSITPNKEDHFIDFMMKKEIPFLALGHVTKGEMRVDDISFGFIDDAKREYENSLEKLIAV